MGVLSAMGVLGASIFLLPSSEAIVCLRCTGNVLLIKPVRSCLGLVMASTALVIALDEAALLDL